jgi:hypothetical protein
MPSGEVDMVKRHGGGSGGGRRGRGHRRREGVVGSGRAAREREAEDSGRAPGARVQGSRRGGTPCTEHHPQGTHTSLQCHMFACGQKNTTYVDYK